MSTIAIPHAAPSRLAPRVTLRGMQVLLAAAFAFFGVMKLTQPVAAVAAQFPWVATAPPALVRFIGLAELAAAFHLARGEAAALPTNVVLGLLAAFVAWGRATAAPVRAAWALRIRS